MAVMAFSSAGSPGCGGAKGKPAASAGGPSGRDAQALLGPVDHARWMPEAAEGEVMERLPDGTARALLGRLRIEVSERGAIRRARELLPQSRPSAQAIALPERLGGGHLFVTGGGGTSLWRARDFLGRLEPLARVGLTPVQVTPGPDRLIVRGLTSDKMLGIDADSGQIEAPLPLPTAPRFGPIAFTDGFHGLVWADLRGLLATSDAGSTWHRVPLSEPPRQITTDGDSFVVWTSASRLRLDGARGGALEPDAPPSPGAPREGPSRGKAPKGLLGERPLRAAVEQGWPLPDGSALVMRSGRLARVRLEDGELLEASPPPALPGEDDAACQAVRYGADVGFACGAPGRGTTLYAWEPPLSARLVARWATPRAVMPSQNGFVVVRGGCAEGAPAQAQAGTSAYCVVSPQGALREIYTRGDVGVERVVALADGRVAVLVPPRGGSDGLLTLLPAGSGAPQTLKLDMPEMPQLRRGLWLDGMVEAQPETLGGWVEAGGVVAGVRVGVRDGAVTVGKGRDEPMVVVSGQLALAAAPPDALSESVDGGFTWSPVATPPALGQGRLTSGPRCGVGGCVVPFERSTWLRVGWGPPADPADLEEVPDQRATPADRVYPQALSLSCANVRVEGPREDEGEVRRAQPIGRGTRPEAGPFMPFFGAAPPSLPQGAAGFVENTHGGASARLYAWTPKGIAAGRSARYQARFYDRFDPSRGVRSTALTVAPFRDEQAMGDAMGAGAYTVVFHGFLDASGKAGMLAGCFGGGRERCDLYGIAEGRAIVPLPDLPDEALSRVFSPSASVVFLDEAWYLAQNVAGAVNVYRFDAGQGRLLARVPRATHSGSAFLPAMLVKRAVGRGLGLLARGAGEHGRSDQDFFVLPLDPDTGEAGEVQRLLPTDLGPGPLRRCAPEQDGWLADVSPGSSVLVKLPSGRVSDAELRVRLDPGVACVDAVAARLQDPPDGKPRPGAKAGDKAGDRSGDKVGDKAPRTSPAGNTIPLVATGTSGKRVLADCQP